MDPTGQRTILHVDLDAFYASVEQRDDASLRGKPVVVGGSSERGVVAAASYEARLYGIHSAMPMAHALRLCPHVVVVRHHFERYHEASNRFFEILADFSPLVESLSLDEAFVDVSGSRSLFGTGPQIAEAIRKRVSAELALVASVGVAPSKFIAKIASDINKPDGLCIVEPGDERSFLHPLPISRLWGVGKVTRERLARLGLESIGDVARYPRSALLGSLGANLGTHLYGLAQGLDDRQVVTEHAPVSIGHEETFERDRSCKDELRAKLLEQSDRVAARLRKAELRASIVVLKIKYGDFRQITRRRTLADPTSDGMVISDAVTRLLAEVEVSDRRGKSTRVRLCGVSACGLEDRRAPRQLSLDEGKRQRGERLGDTLDVINSKFGSDSVRRGG